MKSILFVTALLFVFPSLFGQTSFPYTVELTPVNIPNLQGLHSYAFAQHDGKWLIIGGRKDGIHARQPFNAFPQNQNNADLVVIDVNTQQFWTAPLSVLPTSIAEQLQSTNMNFFQDADTLVVIGGYAFSPTANDHITFPNLTTISVSNVINAVVTNQPYTSYFKQITDEVFAVTGAQMGKIQSTFYLVGGHRFDGRYNPMGNPTFVQTYTNQIAYFSLNNAGSLPSYSNYGTWVDPIHLRRRDYNLLPQIFPNGTEGYTISSGVFQITTDLPFLYPVDITSNGYTPQTTFNQYLSNYHSSKISLFDQNLNEMHMLFFGGISQYYYQNGTLIQDNAVPFVKTISRVTRASDGTLQEFVLPIEMPALKGAGAEFFINKNLSHTHSEIIKLADHNEDTILLGHIYGGILSSEINAFDNNVTENTEADPSIYAVKLIRNHAASVPVREGINPYNISAQPNPFKKEIHVKYSLTKDVPIQYFITSIDGKMIKQGQIIDSKMGENSVPISVEEVASNSTLIVTFVFDNIFFSSVKVVKE
jgi:hypothetical protein